jgi:hypothetical protein
MLISHDHKIICLAVPKTGSTSLHHALAQQFSMRFAMKNGSPALYHLTAEDAARIMGPGKFKSYFSFAVIRNPYDRMVSLYHDFRDQRGAIRSDNFADFLGSEFEARWSRDIHFRPQSFFLCRGQTVMLSSLYRYEDGLDAALIAVSARTQTEPVPLGHARKSDRGAWQDYFADPALRRIVETAYDEDFDLLGYPRHTTST